jgi:hypothetical protein
MKSPHFGAELAAAKVPEAAVAAPIPSVSRSMRRLHDVIAGIANRGWA